MTNTVEAQSMTITEALAEIKTLVSRIQKKRNFILQYVYRPEQMRDPLEGEQGSKEAIRREQQSIDDLETRLVSIRRAIQQSNEEVVVEVNGTTKTIGDWLRWRREVVPNKQAHINSIIGLINSAQNPRMTMPRSLGQQQETHTGGDVVVNIDQQALHDESEGLQEIMGQLDGQLSLKNATVVIRID